MASKSSIREAMASLLHQGSYSDMQVTCRGMTFNVHRNILCTQSSFFQAALNSEFKESTTKVVDLPDDRPEVIERVISFLYVQDYLVTEPTGGGGQGQDQEQSVDDMEAEGGLTRNPSHQHIDVYIAADKLGIPALQEAALAKFTAWAKASQRSLDLLDVASTLNKLDPLYETIFIKVVTPLIVTNKAYFAQQEAFLPLLLSYGKLSATIAYDLATLSARAVLNGIELHDVLDNALERIAKDVGECSCENDCMQLIVPFQNQLYFDPTLVCKVCKVEEDFYG